MVREFLSTHNSIPQARCRILTGSPERHTTTEEFGQRHNSTVGLSCDIDLVEALNLDLAGGTVL